MFDIGLLTYDPETPAFYVMMVTALFAFFLSSLIAITYEFTTKSLYKRAHFLQSLALIGIVAATVMQAIGDSIAIGLGMLGALSIIRFRTVLNDPRNITFMFASLAAGIACGVLGYGIALTGTLVFCAAAWILRFSPINRDHELIGELRLRTTRNDELQSHIERRLNKHCRYYVLERWRSVNQKPVLSMDEQDVPVSEPSVPIQLQEFRYQIRLRDSKRVGGLTASLDEIAGVEDVRVNFRKQDPQL